MSRHVIEIPGWHPARANEYRGRHWSAEAAAKTDCRKALVAFGGKRRSLKAAGKRRVVLTITIGPRGGQPDSDAYDKVVLDSLVRLGLLTGDGPAGIEGRMGVEFVRGPRKSTRITLEDCEA